MQWTRILAGVTVVWLGLMLCAEAYESLASVPQPEQSAGPPSITSIRELAELTLIEVQATEVVATEVSGYTGGTSAIIQVHGSVTLGIDLTEARYLEVDEARRQLVLALPLPDVRRVAIDPLASRVLRCERSGLWHLAIGPAHEDKAITDALAIGRERLLQAASGEDLAQRARRHATEVLNQFVTELGWTLEIRWDA